jgi:hypothetical protein
MHQLKIPLGNLGSKDCPEHLCNQVNRNIFAFITLTRATGAGKPQLHLILGILNWVTTDQQRLKRPDVPKPNIHN